MLQICDYSLFSLFFRYCTSNNKYASISLVVIGQSPYNNILTRLRVLEEYYRRNYLFFPHPWCDFFCIIFLSLGAKVKFQCMEIGLLSFNKSNTKDCVWPHFQTSNDELRRVCKCGQKLSWQIFPVLTYLPNGNEGEHGQIKS